jgi:hypothetical protein
MKKKRSRRRGVSDYRVHDVRQERTDFGQFHSLFRDLIEDDVKFFAIIPNYP